MADQGQSVAISAPSLPRGGGAIQSIGKGLGAVGPTGAAALNIPLPITAGRGFAPSLALNYQSSVGNGLFGLGWDLNLTAIRRRASKGVPHFNDDDVIIGPDGGVWLAARDGQGAVIETVVSRYGDLSLARSYNVVRYFARDEGAFARMEHWRNADDPQGFWLLHTADGELAIYGYNPQSRHADPDREDRVAEWLLEESLNPLGEHILYEYKPEDLKGLSGSTDPGPSRNFTAQRYLWRVRYGNATASPDLLLWTPDQLDAMQWHFDLVFDYGERDDSSGILGYSEDRDWEGRDDFHSSFAYGFELGSLRFVHYVLMFHDFPQELDADAPTLISALKFSYSDLQSGCKVLCAVESQGWSADANRTLERRPPVSFSYQDFEVEKGAFTPFDAMPGLNDGQRYQLVDLYGEGLPGVLYHEDKGWMYREPLRDVGADDPDAVTYGPWQLLPAIPNADTGTSTRQSLADLTGEGWLDWVIAEPGRAGFFTVKPDRTWSHYTPFSALPTEFFHPQAQMADLVGGGLSDLALIGPRSVRLYAHRRAEGFAPGRNVAHDEDDDRLPLLSDSHNELVAFGDILGSGQQHLLRIRHDEVRFWPNLGNGLFGKGQVFAHLPFAYAGFDADHVRLADMDGSGAVDLVYLEPDGFRLFLNVAGRGLAEPVSYPWPAGVRYDRLCQVSLADLQGLGCSSLILTRPHMAPEHWRFDYPAHKPYLLRATQNGMGASGTVVYRSSAQEWLDEKCELQQDGQTVESGVPFAMHLVSKQTQLDEVTGNRLTQRFSYRQGYYDGQERAFRGFGLICQTDTEVPDANANPLPDGFTAPVLSKTWYHNGRPGRILRDLNDSDPQASVLAEDLLTTFDGQRDQVIETPQDTDLREMARSLTGMVLRSEVFGLEAGVPHAVPYSVSSMRYLIRKLASGGPHQPYARLLSFAVESLSYQYEGRADDPMCQRTINLSWDEYGVLTHGVTIQCARRKRAQDTPPFEDEHQQRWWQAAHDDAQQCHYLTETKAQPIHLDAEQSWRLGLPWLSRVNAMMAQASEMDQEQFSYEQLRQPDSSFASLPRTLVALTRQRYVGSGEGEATFQALPDAVELAELDEHALTAYDRVMTPQELNAKLPELGYHSMACFLPAEPARVLWSIKRGFNTYAGPEHFYRVDAFRPTASHGLSAVEYDPYSLLVKSVTAPDGCKTSATFSYYSMQPLSIVDPNQNTQQALYDGFGVLRMTSFYGTELGEEVGFGSLTDVTVPMQTPHQAIENPSTIPFATAACYDAFSWLNDKVPVHSLAMQWDRYPDDPERQLRMTLSSVDGFGRTLQARQLVEPGKAYEVVDGKLSLVDDELVEVEAPVRWRVSERVEYNNKGLAVRVYRPYFSNSHGYVDDSSVREHWHHDKQFYDSLGRPTITLTAKGWMRRITYEGWYTISEDENDTAEEVNARRAEQGLPLLDDGSPRKKKNPFQR